MHKPGTSITSWVGVRRPKAIRNEELFFQSPESDDESFVKALYKKLNPAYPKFYKMDALCRTAFAAAELLLKGRNLQDQYRPEEVALVFSNASASLDTDRAYYSAVEDRSNYFPSPAVFVYTLPNILMGELCIRHRFTGENLFFISEKFNGPLLADYGQQLLDSGKAACVLTGWVEVNEKNSEVVLFLIEKKSAEDSAVTPLTGENMDSIYRKMLTDR